MNAGDNSAPLNTPPVPGTRCRDRSRPAIPPQTPLSIYASRSAPYYAPMSDLTQTAYRDRAVIRLSGEGVRDWLDGLITNSLVPGAPVTFAALLTPQGKIIADFFVTDRGDHLLLDTPPDMGEGLRKRLSMYRLRAPIEIDDVSDTHHLHCSWGDPDSEVGTSDPRMPALGRRIMLSAPRAATGDWDAHRLSLGVPDSQYDFGPSSTFPMDACMDQLNGVDYAKGCFVGQEVVSRMKRMSTVKKRMRGISLTGPADRGDPVKAGERTIGQVLHVSGLQAMALIRLERLHEATQSPTVRGASVTIMDSVLGTDA